MSGKTRALFISLSILALVMFSAIGTIPVYADDGTTSGSTTTDTTTTVTDPGATPTTVPTDTTTTVTDPEATPTTVPTDTTIAVTDPGTPTTENVQPDVVTPPLLQQLPDNTTVTVVDPTGEAQPLVSQDSANAILLSDPIWCPASQTTPTPGANGCTTSYSSFTELLTFLKDNEGDAAYQVDGTIYVQQGAYAGGEQSIDFNSYNFTQLNQKNLTVTGGWDTTNNTVTSTSSFTVPIIIGSNSNPWVGSLSLNNITINGVTDQTGLTLYSQGDIGLSNVEVTNSQNGADLTANGNVKIENSKFNNNTKSGLNIKADKNVSLKNSESSDNGGFDYPGYGLQVESGSSVTLNQIISNNNENFGANIKAAGEVTINQSSFSGNVEYRYYCPSCSYRFAIGGYGLQVVTTGDIHGDGISANGNYFFGSDLTGASVNISNSTFNNNGTGRSEETVGSGLHIGSSGSVTLLGVNANNNERFGADIVAASSVVVKQSFFNGNSSYTYISDVKVFDGYGLKIVTPADVGLNTVTADGNYLYGAHLEGSDVIVNNGSFSNNGSGWVLDLIGRGLEVVAKQNASFGSGDVSLNNITADNNQLFGANILADGKVAIGADTGKVSSFSGHISYLNLYGTTTIADITGGYGLQIVTPKDIALQNVKTNNNYMFGTSLDGNNIAISNSFFSQNGSGVLTKPVGSDKGFGLKVKSNGSVTLGQVEANSNQLYGADIWAKGDVSISAPVNPQAQTFNYFTGNQSVVITPSNVEFFGYGLTVYSQTGDIALRFVEANFNNLWGGSLEGMSVFVNDSQFNNNISDSTTFIDDTGLIIKSHGDFVSLDNVEALKNRLIGAVINSDSGDVYITNSRFNDNAGFTCSLNWCPSDSITYHGYGLQVTTKGLISLTSVDASRNNLFGANLQGSTVSVSNSTFNNNVFGNGLTITTTGVLDPVNMTTGNVTLTNVTADGNGNNGADVTTQDPCAVVKLSGGALTNNVQYGLSVVGGSITFGGTQISGNGVADLFHNPSICVLAPVVVNTNNIATAGNVVQTASTNGTLANTNVVTTTNNTTTLSTGTTNTNTTVSNDKKNTKAKKATVKKHKVKIVKIRHARRYR